MADEMFVALSECASLHPCEDDDDQDEGDCDSEDLEAKRSKIDMGRFEDAAEN